MPEFWFYRSSKKKSTVIEKIDLERTKFSLKTVKELKKDEDKGILVRFPLVVFEERHQNQSIKIVQHFSKSLLRNVKISKKEMSSQGEYLNKCNNLVERRATILQRLCLSY